MDFCDSGSGYELMNQLRRPILTEVYQFSSYLIKSELESINLTSKAEQFGRFEVVMEEVESSS
jgi:hypothetical protein